MTRLAALLALVLGLTACHPEHAEYPGADDTIRDPVESGAQLYATQCASCHQENGTGLARLHPPLDGSARLQGDSAPLIAIMLNGLRGPVEIHGVTYNGVMPMWKDVFSDVQIAAVLTYTRQAWSNRAAPITAVAVADARRALRKNNSFLTAQDLE